MKKNLFLVIWLSLLFSCNNENVIDDSRDNGFSASEKEEYLNYIAELEALYPEKNIYHVYNMPDFSDKVQQIISNSKEEDDYNEITRSSIAATFGPWGGTGGAEFDAPLNLSSSESWKKLRVIKVRAGTLVDAIQLYWINNKGVTTNSSHYGGTGGVEYYVYLSPNEYINKMTVMAASKVNQLTFETNLGNVYIFGKVGGIKVELPFGNSGYQFHGIYGRFGRYLDKIGIYCYPNSMFPIE